MMPTMDELGALKRLKIDLADARQVAFRLECEKGDLYEERDEARAEVLRLKRIICQRVECYCHELGTYQRCERCKIIKIAFSPEEEK
jgi:hypothetical protein